MTEYSEIGQCSICYHHVLVRSLGTKLLCSVCFDERCKKSEREAIHKRVLKGIVSGSGERQ